MLKVLTCCDACGRHLPVREVEVNGLKFEVVETAKTKVWKTENVLPHLCKECALSIDNAVLQFKLSVFGSV